MHHTTGTVTVSLTAAVLLATAFALVLVGPPVRPPAERPARSPVSGARTLKTVVYYGDSREAECRRVREVIFEWNQQRFPVETSRRLIVRYRKYDEPANIHVVETYEFPHLAKQREVTRIPCWVFLSAGREVGRRHGFLKIDELLEFWRDPESRPNITAALERK